MAVKYPKPGELMDRSAVFIDGGYLDKVLQNEFERARVDYRKLSDLVSQGTDRLRTYYYHCMPWQGNPPDPAERARFSSMDSFFYNLKQLPRFEVRLGKIARRGADFQQKRVDVLLSVDLVRMSWDHQIQRAIIVSGDSDYVPAVLAAKDAGVLVQLYYHPNSVHDELRSACDDRFEITSALVQACSR